MGGRRARGDYLVAWGVFLRQKRSFETRTRGWLHNTGDVPDATVPSNVPESVP